MDDLATLRSTWSVVKSNHSHNPAPGIIVLQKVPGRLLCGEALTVVWETHQLPPRMGYLQVSSFPSKEKASTKHSGIITAQSSCLGKNWRCAHRTHVHPAWNVNVTVIQLKHFSTDSATPWPGSSAQSWRHQPWSGATYFLACSFYHDVLKHSIIFQFEKTLWLRRGGANVMNT